MACTTTLLGVAIDCGNIGGLKKVYIAATSDVSGVTLSGETISAITMTSGKTFKEFSFRKGNANFVSTNNHDDKAGTSFVETVLTAQFNKMETVKRTEMKALMNGQVYVIALDQNGIYWMLGYASYVSSSVNGQSGAEMGDGNFYTLTATTQTADLPIEVLSTAITAIV